MSFDKFNLSDDGLGSLGFTRKQIDEITGIAAAQVPADYLSATARAAIEVSRSNLIGIDGIRAGHELGMGALGSVLDAARSASLGGAQGLAAQAHQGMPGITSIPYDEIFDDDEPAEASAATFSIHDAAPVAPWVPPLPEPSEPCEHEGRVRELEAENAALRSELHELKMLRLSQCLDATTEHKPKPPVIDSQFPDN